MNILLRNGNGTFLLSSFHLQITKSWFIFWFFHQEEKNYTIKQENKECSNLLDLTAKEKEEEKDYVPYPAIF